MSANECSLYLFDAAGIVDDFPDLPQGSVNGRLGEALVVTAAVFVAEAVDLGTLTGVGVFGEEVTGVCASSLADCTDEREGLHCQEWGHGLFHGWVVYLSAVCVLNQVWQGQVQMFLGHACHRPTVWQKRRGTEGQLDGRSQLEC